MRGLVRISTGKVGHSVKRSGPFSEPLGSESWKVAVLIPFPKLGRRKSSLNQRKTKGQQLKGKIVSEFSTLFRTFS